MIQAVDDGLGEAIPVQPPDRPYVPWQSPYEQDRSLVEASEVRMNRIDRIAAKIATIPSENALDGMTNEQARRNVNQLLSHYTRGFFSDQSWEAVNKIWQALTAAQLDWTMTNNEYYKNDRGIPSGKIWKFEVKFVNKKGRPTTMYGTVTAAGAGSVQDPLDRYDLTALVY